MLSLMILVKLIAFTLMLLGGILSFSSGLRKERKAFFWLNGYGRIIKNPMFNILYGIILILIGVIGLLYYIVRIF